MASIDLPWVSTFARLRTGDALRTSTTNGKSPYRYHSAAIQNCTFVLSKLIGRVLCRDHMHECCCISPCPSKIVLLAGQSGKPHPNLDLLSDEYNNVKQPTSSLSEGSLCCSPITKHGKFTSFHYASALCFAADRQALYRPCHSNSLVDYRPVQVVSSKTSQEESADTTRK